MVEVNDDLRAWGTVNTAENNAENGPLPNDSLSRQLEKSPSVRQKPP